MSSTSDGLAPNSGTLKWKLFGMMVLEFFIWGAWLPLVFGYMSAIGFSSNQMAWIGSCFAIATIVGIFFSNQWADRTFSAERFMATSHLLGGLSMIGLFFTRDFYTFFVLMLVHSLCYVPTISVSNSLAFANLKNPTKEFGIIRMGGTIGWILAAWPFYFILGGKTGEDLIAAQSTMFLVSGAGSLLLAIYSLTLPHTPPQKAVSGERLAFLKAFSGLKIPFLAVLFVVTFIDATIHNGYFLFAGSFLEKAAKIPPQWITPVMSIGQIAEIATMVFLGVCLSKLGWKTTMIIGILGHAARYMVFAFMPDSQIVIILVQVLHGICYAFFFATVYIFIDKAFPKDIRSSAQGLFNLLILGIGDLAAKWFFLPLQERLTVDGVVDYKTLFLVPAGMSIAAALLLAVGFWPSKEITVDDNVPGTAPH